MASASLIYLEYSYYMSNYNVHDYYTSSDHYNIAVTACYVNTSLTPRMLDFHFLRINIIRQLNKNSTSYVMLLTCNCLLLLLQTLLLVYPFVCCMLTNYCLYIIHCHNY